MLCLDKKPRVVVWIVLFLALRPAGATAAMEPAGVKVWIEDYQGPATLGVRSVGRYGLEIDFDPNTEGQGVVIRVDLPVSGRGAWPAADVEVLDSEGQPVPVRRPGIEWHKLRITVAPEPETFVVHVVEGKRRPIRPEKERHATDPETGFGATICPWHDGRRAALSLRFDDSHPTHLSTAVPILDEYGFRGTFMVNPGSSEAGSASRRRSAFQAHLAAWEAVARRGDHEFANHTLDHQGARNDAEMDYQIGRASDVIWELFPNKGRLIALNLGGGTWWTTTKTLRFYLDKHHLFDASSGSCGMDDVYGNRVSEFRRLLERHLEGGGWFRAHYHSIGEGLGSSEANFRAALEVAKAHESDLWIAGMADIHKYQTERLGAALAMEKRGPGRIDLQLSCGTDAELYDQPLTIEVRLPRSWPPGRVAVENAQKEAIPIRRQGNGGDAVLRFDVAPRDALYSLFVTR